MRFYFPALRSTASFIDSDRNDSDRNDSDLPDFSTNITENVSPNNMLQQSQMLPLLVPSQGPNAFSNSSENSSDIDSSNQIPVVNTSEKYRICEVDQMSQQMGPNLL